MVEPPTKRQRRTDSSTMWEQNEPDRPSSAPKGAAPRRDAAKSNSKYQPRSPDRTGHRREHTINKREKESDSRRDRDRGPRDRRDGRDYKREDTRRPPQGKHHYYNSRVSHAGKSNTIPDDRSRSPPRGPRGQRPRSRERYAPRNNGADRASKAEPPARATAPTTNRLKDVRMVDTDAPEEEFEAQMKALMGFGKFKSTKNTKVPGNDKLYAVRKDKKTKYRQYMNRKDGFNRPLSPVKD
ncbi:MAG: hypothetical protein M1820_002259 [Bogoriella megaspora]|nr:MAG: hypothetical protein M1820_002259 [Bogoriella megaspora]